LQRLSRDHQARPVFLARERSQLRRPTRMNLVGARLVLDPANGPQVPGWRSADGTAEHEVTWAIASAMEGRLTALGASITLTRGPATSPSAAERASLANDSDAELIVSIGLNGSSSHAAAGATASFFGTREYESQRGRRLADVLLARSVEALGTADCRSHPSTVSILRLSRAPTAIIEPGFLTNPGDAAQLTDPAGQLRIAGALADGIVAFLTEAQG